MRSDYPGTQSIASRIARIFKQLADAQGAKVGQGRIYGEVLV
jgi:hypothetical protein